MKNNRRLDNRQTKEESKQRNTKETQKQNNSAVMGVV
jgi:hypothetical protein